MKKIMIFRLTPISESDGTNTHCQALSSLFESDKDIAILPIDNFKLHKIPVVNISYHSQSDIEEAIKRYTPDIIHIHGTYNYAIISAIKIAEKYGIKIILSPHFHPFKFLNRPFFGQLFFNVFIRPNLKKCTSIITINNEDTRFFKKYCKKVIRIPHWNLLSKRNEKKPTKNNHRILFVGRLDANKGIEHLYSIPEGKYQIHIVGQGKLINRSDFFHHVNITNEELNNLYKESDVVVVPSRYEAFSYVSLEALMSNTPIVISNRVRIGDYLKGLEYVSVFEYHNMIDFNNAIDRTIGKNVDIDTVSSIFNQVHIKDLYKKVYLS